MPEYRYEAVDDAGEKLEGTMTAKSFKEVIAKIVMSRHYPTRVEELSKQGSIHYRRLDRFKQIRDLFVPKQQSAPEEFHPIKQNGFKYLVILFVLVWITMLIIYLASQAPS